jgi:hypothetical protein
VQAAVAVPEPGPGVLRGLPAWYRWCRHARVLFHTTRTHPNVRFSTLACAWSGYARHLYAVLTNIKLIRYDPNR